MKPPYEPDNFDKFIKSVLLVAESNKLANFGQNAHDIIMRRYTWDTHVNKIIK